jgi:hypothetical protein
MRLARNKRTLHTKIKRRQIKRMTIRPDILAIVFLIVITILSLEYIHKRQKAIKEKIIAMAREKEKEITVAVKERERLESKIHVETRIRNFLRTNEGIRYTEKQLIKETTLNRKDLVNFHGILIALTHYQQRFGYGYQADHSNIKNPIFYFYFETPKQK